MLTRLAIITTLRCDLKCRHCLRGYPKERPDFPLELLDKLLSEAVPFGANHVGLTGGETRLYPHFEAMVDKIVAYGYSWHFVSNGQETAPYLRVMEKHPGACHHVSLSIDSATAAIHDEIRRKKGAFERVVASAREYVQAGYSVMIGSVLNQKNKHEMEALLNLAMEIGASGIRFGGVIPTPWNQDLVLNDEESLALWEEANRLREKTGFDLQTVSALRSRGGVNFCDVLNFRELTFNTRGALIFCCDTNEQGAEIGSLAERSFSDLVQKWLDGSSAIQHERARRIAAGNMGPGFDTCAFCNNYLPIRSTGQ